MKRLLLSFSAAMLALTIVVGPVGTARPALAEMASPTLADDRGIPTLAPVIEQVSDPVVNIAVVSERPAQLSPLFRDPFFAPFLPPMPPEGPVQRQMSAGSGVIVDAARGHPRRKPQEDGLGRNGPRSCREFVQPFGLVGQNTPANI
jgi:S1-C subfamily serine protease